jgi:hypothetical protein
VRRHCTTRPRFDLLSGAPDDLEQARIARDDQSDGTPIKLTVEDQGLYLARQCAVAHGGSLNLEPIPGRGARFVLTLPDYDEASLALLCGEREIAER